MLNSKELGPLEAELRRLRKSFAQKISDLPGSKDHRIGSGSAVQPRNAPTRTQLEVELKRVEAALVRIAAGTFGICRRCELAIDVERLTADPATPFCRECFEELTSQRQRSSRY